MVRRRKMDPERKAFINNLFRTLSTKGCSGYSGHAQGFVRRNTAKYVRS